MNIEYKIEWRKSNTSTKYDKWEDAGFPTMKVESRAIELCNKLKAIGILQYRIRMMWDDPFGSPRSKIIY